MRYETYIVSPAWKKRRDTFVKGRTICQNCEEPTERFEVHHLVYDSLGHELDHHLMALCPKCHRAVHGKRSKARAAKRKRWGTTKAERKARRAGVCGSSLPWNKA